MRVIGSSATKPRRPNPDPLRVGPATLGKAVASGWISALMLPEVLLLKWAVNVAFALVATAPVMVLLDGYFAHGTLQETTFADVSLDTLLEFRLVYEGELRLALLACIPLALAYVLLNLFFTGGILDCLAIGTGRSWAMFYNACKRHFWRLAGMGLCALVLFAVVVALPHLGLARLVDVLTEKASSPRWSFYCTWIHWGILLFLFSLVARMYDYARAVLLLQPDRGAINAMLRGARFTLRHGTGTVILWLLLCSLSLVLLYGYALVTDLIGLAGLPAVWLNFVVGQLFIVLRIAAGIARLGGQMELFCSGD